MRRRTVSLEVAASSACWMTDGPSASAHPEVVLGRGEERRPHPHPGRARARARRPPAVRCRYHRRPAPGVVPDRVDDLRPQHHRADLTGVPAGLVALRDRRCPPRCRHAARACLAVPASAATGTPAACACSMTSFGGEPRALAIRLIGCSSATSTCERATECSQPSTPSLPGSVVGQRRHPEVGQGLGDEVTVGLRDQLVDVDGGALGGHLRRHHDVDAVGLAVGVVVHPAQHGLEFVGMVEPDAAQHAHPAGPGDRRGDLLRRGEDEDRVVDAEPVAQFGAHQLASALPGACLAWHVVGRAAASVCSLAHL